MTKREQIFSTMRIDQHRLGISHTGRCQICSGEVDEAAVVNSREEEVASLKKVISQPEEEVAVVKKKVSVVDATKRLDVVLGNEQNSPMVRGFLYICKCQNNDLDGVIVDTLVITVE